VIESQLADGLQQLNAFARWRKAEERSNMAARQSRQSASITRSLQA
jgi:hypothetical protein